MGKRQGKDEEEMRMNLLFLLTFSFPFLIESSHLNRKNSYNTAKIKDFNEKRF